MARAKNTDPRRLDVRALAEAAGELQGSTPLAELPRLADSLLPLPGDGAPPPARWHARGEQRPVTGGAPEVWLRLEAAAEVTLQCQRCLQPMAEPLAVDRAFRFVATEDEAARLDEETEDDVLVLQRSFDLLALLEDEFILALPIVPRHATCPEPLPLPVAEPEETEAPANPFAALAALRRPPR